MDLFSRQLIFILIAVFFATSLIGGAVYFSPQEPPAAPVTTAETPQELPPEGQGDTTAEETPAPPKAATPQQQPLPSGLSQTIQPQPLPITGLPQYSLEPRPIDLRAIVGLQCNFEGEIDGAFAFRGSGVFIHLDGYILTNRHIVDAEYSRWVSGNEGPIGKLIDCEVRFLNYERTLSSTEPVSFSWRGVLDLKNFGGKQYDFKARLVYLPDTLDLSKWENQQLDYAVLKVTETNSAKYFGGQGPQIHYAPVLSADTAQWLSLKGESVIIPGFAFQPIELNLEESFATYLLSPIDGKISDIAAGDRVFKDKPFLLWTETFPDAFGGRSGSPIFYKGYVIGLFQSKGLPSDTPGSYLYSYQTSINAVLENIAPRLGGNISSVFKETVSFE